MALIKALRDGKRHLRREPEATVRLALQARQIEECGRQRRRLFRAFRDDTRLTGTLVDDSLRLFERPNALGL